MRPSSRTMFHGWRSPWTSVSGTGPAWSRPMRSWYRPRLATRRARSPGSRFGDSSSAVTIDSISEPSAARDRSGTPSRVAASRRPIHARWIPAIATSPSPHPAGSSSPSGLPPNASITRCRAAGSIVSTVGTTPGCSAARACVSPGSWANDSRRALDHDPARRGVDGDQRRDRPRSQLLDGAGDRPPHRGKLRGQPRRGGGEPARARPVRAPRRNLTGSHLEDPGRDQLAERPGIDVRRG